jgi:hypothetical protein
VCESHATIAIIRRSLHVVELVDLRTEEIAIDAAIALDARFFVSQVGPQVVLCS